MGLAAREQNFPAGHLQPRQGHLVSLGLVWAVGGLTLHRHPAESPASFLWVSPGDFSLSPAGGSSSSILCVFVHVPGS